MISNTNFNNALRSSGMSMYALAKYSGVPYTTINELHNGKNDINKCPAVTVCRLSAVLGVSFDEIMNPIDYLDGVKGRYRGIDYTWSTDEFSQITFKYQGEPVTIRAGAHYNIPSRLKYYQTIAEWLIKEHVEHIELEKDWDEFIARRFGK